MFCSCFLSHVGVFWGAFLAPIVAIMLFNVILFVCIIVVVIRFIKRKKAESESMDHKAIIRTMSNIFGLMFLFGLTWLFAVLTFSVSGLRETFQLLFTVFNSLQGAFIFLFTCVLSSQARKGWKSMLSHGKSAHVKFSHYKPRASSTGGQSLGSGISYSNPLQKVTVV